MEIIETSKLEQIVERYQQIMLKHDDIVKSIKEYNNTLDFFKNYFLNSRNASFLKLDEKIEGRYDKFPLQAKIKQDFIEEIIQIDKLKIYFSDKQFNKIYQDVENLCKNDKFTIDFKSATDLINSIYLNSGNLIQEQFKTCYKILTNDWNFEKNIRYKTLGGWKINKKSKVKASNSGDINEVIKCFNLLDNVYKVENMFNWRDFYNFNYSKNTQEVIKDTFECDYFTAKLYKNGYAHLIFKNDELVNKFNLKIGSLFNWLPY